jgi:DNA-binding LacI/PurR family transcriptional regulator
VATAHGKRIILGNTGEDPARERQLIADFIGRQVEGLILVPSSGASDHLKPERLGITPPALLAAQLLFDRLSADVPATARTLELPVRLRAAEQR